MSVDAAWMEAYEIADSVPVGLFCTVALAMQAHHGTHLFTEARFDDAFDG